MLRKLLLITTCVSLGSAPRASAQADQKLGLLIPNLFGPRGLVVDSQAVLPDGSTHSAHFNSAFQSEFTQFNVALASALASVPLPSPASGYTYTLDPSLGVLKRSTQSFGPILTDRGETIGKGKFTFGFNYQRFDFDTLEGVPLDEVPAVFTHDDFQLGGGRTDVVTTVNAIDMKVSQVNMFFTYGLTSRLDVSLAIPISDVSLGVVSDATVRRIGTVDPAIHFFRDARGGLGDSRRFAASGSASGIGDVVLRLKGTAPRSGPTSLGLYVDVRFPTGDEEELLGSGAFGIKPALILSWAIKRFSPHLNLAYAWNGDSALAGDLATGSKGDLPDQFFFAAGFDVGLSEKITVAADVLGQRTVDAPRLVRQTFTAANGRTFDQIGFERGAINIINGAVGVKVNAGGSLLLDFNVLFKLNEEGLRASIAPLFGLEYSF